MRSLFQIGLVLVPVVVLIAMFPPKQQPSKTPEQKAHEAQKNDRFWREVRSVALLKRTTKDPDSFELVTAVKVANETLCLTYRARNSFNAKMVAQAVLGPTVFSTSETEEFYAKWKRYCAGKTGSDESGTIRMGLSYL